MRAFTNDALPGRVVFGPGTRARIGDEVAALGGSRAFLIASGSASAAADEVAEQLGERLAARWSEVREHVPVELADRARSAARESAADVLVAIGGGSATGLAKAVALVLDAPIVAVPTTYSGSELTPLYGLTDAEKHTGSDRRVLPQVVVYDPVLTLGLPPAVTTASAGNALAHCVEGLYAAGASPVTDLLAAEGTRVLGRALPAVVAAPGDLEARSDLLYGAYLGGAVLAGAGTALHHRLCHVLGGAFGLPHGEVHSILLPHVAAFNASAAPAQLAVVGRALGAGIGDEALDAGCAGAALYDLLSAAGAPVGLRSLGLREDQLDAAAEQGAAEASGNPRPADVPSVRALLDDAFHGRRPG